MFWLMIAVAIYGLFMASAAAAVVALLRARRRRT